MEMMDLQEGLLHHWSAISEQDQANRGEEMWRLQCLVSDSTVFNSEGEYPSHRILRAALLIAGFQ